MPRTALIVDDSATFRQMVSLTLSEAGFTVLQAANGEEGLNVLKTKKPDVIISDVNMPVMDGLTFVSRVRTTTMLRSTPILMLTTEAEADMKQKGKAAGATGWIVKPFKPQQLLQIVKDLLP